MRIRPGGELPPKRLTRRVPRRGEPRSSGSASRSGTRRLRRATLVLVGIAAAAACSRPLPESESREARVYVQECALCHPPIHPGVMTPAMWRIQVDRMDELRRRRGLPPLADEHRALILEYLDRNAG